MLCPRCRTSALGPDGRCPRCDGDPWSVPPAGQAPAPASGQAYGAGYSPAPGPQYGPGGSYGPGYAYPSGQPYPQGQYQHHGPGQLGGAPGHRPPVPVRVPFGLATALYVLLGLGAVADALALVAAGMEFSLFGRLESGQGRVDVSEADAVDAFYALTAVGGFVLFAATAVVFLIWFYRVRVNAEQFGPAWTQRHGRAWAVGAWFTPFVNLWLPKRLADDIWNASDPTARHTDPYTGAGAVSRTGLVWGWWLAWLGTNLLSTLSTTMDRTTSISDYAGMQGVYGVEMAGMALSVGAAVLAFLVVRRITTMQGVRHAMTAGGTPPGQPVGPGWPHQG